MESSGEDYSATDRLKDEANKAKIHLWEAICTEAAVFSIYIFRRKDLDLETLVF